MKTISRRIIPAMLFLMPLFGSATNYNDNGSTVNYHLNSGDTLKILSGNYRGNINTFAPNAVIYITSNGTFTPGSINNPQGTIINYGTATLSFSLSAGQYFQLKNYQYCTINGAGLNGTFENWYNSFGSILTLNGSLQMNANNTVFVNDGNLDVHGSVALNPGSQFTNRFKVSTTNTFNVNGGTFTNEGEIDANGTVTFNSGVSVNSCRLVIERNFSNNGVITNNGLIWAPKKNYSNTITNNGTITNGAFSVIKGTDLSNFGTINGKAKLYFTGTTYTSGVVGTPGLTSDSVKMYDLSRLNPLTIFDSQFGTVYPNTIYKVLPAPDTINGYVGCSDIFKASYPLPVSWTSFKVRLVREEPVVSWTADFDANTKFEVERSYDRIHFDAIATMNPNQDGSYSFTDHAVNKSAGLVYYRVKGVHTLDGTTRFTEIRSVRFDGPATSLTLYPNPVVDQLHINFTSANAGTVLIQIKNTGGQTLVMKTLAVTAGLNRVELNEVKSFAKGAYFVELVSGSSIMGTERFIK